MCLLSTLPCITSLPLLLLLLLLRTYELLLLLLLLLPLPGLLAASLRASLSLSRSCCCLFTCAAPRDHSGEPTEGGDCSATLCSIRCTALSGALGTVAPVSPCPAPTPTPLATLTVGILRCWYWTSMSSGDTSSPHSEPPCSSLQRVPAASHPSNSGRPLCTLPAKLSSIHCSCHAPVLLQIESTDTDTALPQVTTYISSTGASGVETSDHPVHLASQNTLCVPSTFMPRVSQHSCAEHIKLA